MNNLLSPINDIVTLHGTFQTRDLFCTSHQVTICHECFVTTHKDCSSKVTADLTPLARDARSELNHWATKLRKAEDELNAHDEVLIELDKEKANMLQEMSLLQASIFELAVC